jgi:hypothetical protein
VRRAFASDEQNLRRVIDDFHSEVIAITYTDTDLEVTTRVQDGIVHELSREQHRLAKVDGCIAYRVSDEASRCTRTRRYGLESPFKLKGHEGHVSRGGMGNLRKEGYPSARLLKRALRCRAWAFAIRQSRT